MARRSNICRVTHQRSGVLTVFRMGVIKYIGWTFAWLVAFVCATWATGALYFDFPTVGALAAILFVIILFAAMVFVRGKLRKLAIVFGASTLVALWWRTLKPSNDRAWQPDVARTAWAEINGDVVTVRNARNCDYRNGHGDRFGTAYA
jgi:hypothetical protein